MKQYFMAVFVLIVTAFVGLTMPLALLERQDQERLENIETQTAEEVILTSHTELTLIEKLQLMQKDTVTYLSMVQGKNYDWDSIIVQVQQELKKLCELEILNLERIDLLYSVEDVGFLIDIEDESRSMLMWTLNVVTDEWVITVTADDETGKILGISQVEMSASESYTNMQKAEVSEAIGTKENLKKIAEKWGEYLGISLIESYDRQNPTADLEKEWEKEIDAWMQKGCSNEEAYKRVYQAWGDTVDSLTSWAYGVYEDESGMAAYMFRKNSGSVIFLAEPSLQIKINEK